LFKFKKGDNFNHPDEKDIGACIHTLSISRINLPTFCSGLKFEPDPELVKLVYIRWEGQATGSNKDCTAVA